MQNIFKKAIDNVGVEVTFFNGDDFKKGNAVIYPVRRGSDEYNGRESIYEGISEPERYVMYCNEELVEDVKHGDIVKYDENGYMVLWVDRYSCKQGAYIKVYLKKFADKE